MFGSAIKFLSAILVTVVTITLISFIGNKAIIAGELEKDAVSIEIPKTPEVAQALEVEETIEASEEIVAKEPEEAPQSFVELLSNADIKKGSKLKNKCAACHSFKSGGKHKIGPNIWNIVDADIASKEGFKYSKALTSLDGNWDYDKLNKFMKKPKKFAPGTKMGYAGMKKIEDRAALIAWLRMQADVPAPLPSE